MKKLILIIILIYIWKYHQAELRQFYDYCLPFKNWVEKQLSEWRAQGEKPVDIKK